MLCKEIFKQVGALWMAVVVMGSVAIGCGGGSDGATAGSRDLTRTQFVKQATAVCLHSSEEKDQRLRAAVKSEGKKGLLAASPSELEDLAKSVVFPLYGETISQLRDLSPPARDEAKIAKILNTYEAALKEAEANPSMALEANPFAKADDAATEYGIICSL